MSGMVRLARPTYARVSREWPSARNRPGAENQDVIGALECAGVLMSYTRHAEIYGEGEPAEYLYKVVSGSARTYKVLYDGRRQVGGFYLRSDIFGLETGSVHTFSAEATTKCEVLVMKYSALLARAKTDHEIAFQLWMLTGSELRRLQDHLLLLIKNATERVAAFLLDLGDRASTGNSVELTMSRQDIADYLGLTIETVSRTLAHLETMHAIELVSARRIVLHDRGALARLNAGREETSGLGRPLSG